MITWKTTSLQFALLRLYLWHFCWVFLAVHLFVAVGSTVTFWVENPFIPLRTVWTAAPDLVLVVMPVSIPFSALIGGTLYIQDVHRQQGFLWVQLAGQTVRAQQLPIMVLAGALSLITYGLNSRVIPQALTHTRLALRSFAVNPSIAASRLTYKPHDIGGYHISIGDAQGEELQDIAMLTQRSESNFAIVAKRARVDYRPDSASIDLRLSQGRLLGVDSTSRLHANLLFQGLTLGLNARSQAHITNSKLALINPKFYTTPELTNLRAQGLKLMSHGITLDEHQQRHIDSVAAVMATRVQSALLPVIFLVLILTFCGVSRDRTVGIKLWATNIACLLVIVPQQIYLQSLAHKGGASSALTMLLPTFEVIAAIGLCHTMARWKFWRRPC